jgi:hypothetical protein
MGRELGRISGPLLSDNLLRNGTNLVFDSDLLQLNVGTKRLGVNVLGPSRDLTVANGIDTTELLVDTQAEMANFVLTSNQIQNPLSTITISPAQSNPVIATPRIATSLLAFSDNTLLNSTLGSNIEFTPSGTGVSNIRNDTTVNGNVHATGDITWDGDVQLGNAITDTITFAADVDSNILPNTNNAYNFGSPLLKWNTAYTANVDAISLSATLVNTTTATIGNIKLQGNTITNTDTSVDINLAPNGTGLTYFNGVNYVNGNTIPVTSLFTLNSTLNGYTKFADTYGLAIPVGLTTELTGIETGTLRYDPNYGYVRVFNGTNWQPVGGVSETLNVSQVTDVMWAWDLILG